jgi:outer membrane protein assembly factor BamB
MKLPLYDLGERELKKQKPLLKGTDVRRLQQVLKHIGFFQEKIDGVYGDETSYSVRTFQKAFGKRINGIADKSLLNTIDELKRSRAGVWLTYRKDYAHTGFLPLPLGYDLKIRKTWGIAEVTGMICYAGILIISSKKGLYCFDISSGRMSWKLPRLVIDSPISMAEYKILVPNHELLIIDAFSGRIEKSIDGADFVTPVAVGKGKIYASAADGAVYALDLNGNGLWRFKPDGAFSTPPTWAYDLVYFASYDHYIYCFDDKGLPYWKTKIPGLIDLSLCVEDSMVYAISTDSWFYGLNPLTGEILWKRKFSDERFDIPAFSRDLMVAVSDRGSLYALSPQRADLKWVKELAVSPTTPPLLSSKAVFLGTENGLVAMDVQSGEYKTYLEGKKINCLAQGRMELYAALPRALVVLKPNL